MVEVPKFHARAAALRDAGAISRIWNEGIEDRLATFETALRSEDEVASLLDGRPAVVIERDGAVAAWAWAGPYSARKCYAGIGDLSVYVSRERRREGLGAMALRELEAECVRRGFWKLVGRVFVENEPSRALLRRAGFRDVGVHLRHAQLDGRWRDVVVVEKRLGDAADDAEPRATD